MYRVEHFLKGPNVNQSSVVVVEVKQAGFFPGGWGSPHLAKKLSTPPHPTLVPVFGPRLVPPS